MKHFFQTMQIVLASSVILAATAADTMSGTNSKMDNKSYKNTTSSKTWDSSQIEKFVKKAANTGLQEVRMGEMAQERATSQQVREFARLMVTDHSEANQKLKTAGESHGWAVPSNVEKKYQDKIDELGKKSDKDFDKDYIKSMVKDHKEDISDFEKAEKNLPAGALKTWVMNTLPVLRKHLANAEAIEKSMANK